MIRVNQILVYTLAFDCFIHSGWTNNSVFNGLLERHSAELVHDPIIKCPSKGILRHAMPGSRCQRYYTCRDGAVITQSCPVGTLFSHSNQRCKAEGSCFEIVCVGRRDGSYWDNSTGGTRVFKCSGGRVAEITNTGVKESQQATVVEKGEAALVFRLPSACKGKPDGFHPLTPVHDFNSDCSVYVRCKSEDDIEIITCPAGQFFDGHRCSNSAKPCRDKCWGKSDGLHNDDAIGCSGYVVCDGGKTKARHKCPPGTFFNGKTCSLGTESCVGVANYCRGLGDGLHPDAEDVTCRRFIQCSGGKMIVKSCPQGQTWNGTGCSSSQKACSWTRSIDCVGRHGYIAVLNRNCTAFSFCHSGLKTTYSCRAGTLFNGSRCVSARSYKCPRPDENSCEGKRPGYYVDTESNCRAYFYCGAGPHRISYVCPMNQIFDGERCVLQSAHRCSNPTNDECSKGTDGYRRRHHHPQEYIFCQDGVKLITLNCPEHHQLDPMRGCTPEV